MKNISHKELVTALVKSGQDIIKEMTPERAHNMHMAIGISGESGELLDAVKKQCMYSQELDRANVIEELGDLEFYMEGLRQGLGITREETLHGNIEKLSQRYVSMTFSNKDAQERKDKQS